MNTAQYNFNSNFTPYNGVDYVSHLEGRDDAYTMWTDFGLVAVEKDGGRISVYYADGVVRFYRAPTRTLDAHLPLWDSVAALFINENLFFQDRFDCTRDSIACALRPAPAP